MKTKNFVILMLILTATLALSVRVSKSYGVAPAAKGVAVSVK